MITDLVWDASRLTKHLESLSERDLTIFYNVGTNDSVSPALRKLGKKLPDLPICIIPGGQHGGPANAGFTTRTPLLPEIKENLVSFAKAHFQEARSLPEMPAISAQRVASQLNVIVTFPDGTEPEKNELWWCSNRNRPYTLPYEFDEWKSIPLEQDERGVFLATIPLEKTDKRIDFLSLHTHTENHLPLTFSSRYQSLKIQL
ncbi:MAG: hypothetical protein MI807_07940 [Verrucomicrobiales bacterium]|nr:hypothetical protein [Verrucomicrobiales bacterium]